MDIRHLQGLWFSTIFMNPVFYLLYGVCISIAPLFGRMEEGDSPYAILSCHRLGNLARLRWIDVKFLVFWPHSCSLTFITCTPHIWTCIYQDMQFSLVSSLLNLDPGWQQTYWIRVTCIHVDPTLETTEIFRIVYRLVAVFTVFSILWVSPPPLFEWSPPFHPPSPFMHSDQLLPTMPSFHWTPTDLVDTSRP